MAIFTVHIGNGLFIANNGYEYGLTLFGALTALAVQGGGRLSFDNLLFKKLNG